MLDALLIELPVLSLPVVVYETELEQLTGECNGLPASDPKRQELAREIMSLRRRLKKARLALSVQMKGHLLPMITAAGERALATATELRDHLSQMEALNHQLQDYGASAEQLAPELEAMLIQVLRLFTNQRAPRQRGAKPG